MQAGKVFRVLSASILISSTAVGHGKKSHSKPEPTAVPAPPEEAANQRERALAKIAESYLANLKPIFEKKCADCHSNQTHYPWYHAIPGVRQMINDDIAKALEHLDLSNDFPFRGHGTAESDLEAVRDVANDGSMPPWTYRLMHSGSGLSEAETGIVSKWAAESLEALRAAMRKETKHDE